MKNEKKISLVVVLYQSFYESIFTIMLVNNARYARMEN